MSFHRGSDDVIVFSLPGGFCRFVPCRIGANHFWLRHIAWERSVAMGLLQGQERLLE